MTAHAVTAIRNLILDQIKTAPLVASLDIDTGSMIPVDKPHDGRAWIELTDDAGNKIHVVVSYESVGATLSPAAATSPA